MHLYIAVRGIKNWHDQFINELQGKYLPFKWRNVAAGEKELKLMQVQLSVRPIQLYEIVFPEDQKDIILNTILDDYGDKQYTQHKWHEKVIFMVRKMLKIDPIPEYKKDLKMPITKQNIEVVGIGVKKDYWTDLNGKNIYDPTEEQKKTCFEGL